MDFSEIKQKKHIIIPLILAVLVIWGYNLAQILSISIGNGEQAIQSEIGLKDKLNLTLENSNYNYNGNFRDPFDMEIFHAKKKASPKSVPVEEDNSKSDFRPPIQLTGIIQETAIIEDTYNQVHFAVKGEKVNDKIVIQAVYSDSILVSYRNMEFVYKLRPDLTGKNNASLH